MAEEVLTAPDALSREIGRERVQSARCIDVLRLCGVSAFFALKPLSLEPLVAALAPLLAHDGDRVPC